MSDRSLAPFAAAWVAKPDQVEWAEKNRSPCATDSPAARGCGVGRVADGRFRQPGRQAVSACAQQAEPAVSVDRPQQRISPLAVRWPGQLCARVQPWGGATLAARRRPALGLIVLVRDN